MSNTKPAGFRPFDSSDGKRGSISPASVVLGFVVVFALLIVCLTLAG